MDERVRIDLINEQCFKITVNEYDQELLEIDLSNWHDLVEESILKEHALNAKMISFKLDDVGILRTELCEWISEYIAPKIVELSITSCHQFSWKYLKTLLENAYSVGSICLQKNHWVNDDVVEQLSRKYSKTLQYFDLEYTKITDNSLFHLGQRCLKLRSIRLDCCPKVTNAGLIELSRRIHLISIHICHNMNITDRSIETLLSQSSELSSLKLTNCPNLTDKSMEVLHEVVVSWGKTRNTKSKLLTIVEFRDNENISSMGVLMLANSAVSLVSLDLRDCSNIDWLEGLEHLSYMKNLKYLKIGPTTPRTRIRNTVQAVKYLSVHSSRLLTLHLNGITEFSDEDIADILENADIMEELSVSNMRFGTNAVESLCSNNPNISRLSVCGSEIFQDIDLRCVCTVCLHLVELTVQRCPLLTDGGFSRCAILRRLQKLDVTDCSSNMSGTLFGCFGLCPLQTLVVGSLHRICPKRDFERFSPLTVNSVRMISIRNCDNVNTEDISFILSQFLNCLELDFTGCRQLVKADVLMKIKHTHPFLNLVIDGVPVHRKFSVPIEHSTNYGGDTVASLLDARGRSVVVASQTVGVVAGSASVGNTPLKKKRKRKGTKDAPPTPTNTTLAAVPVDGPEFLEAPRGFYGFKAFAVERMKHQQYVAVVSGYKKLHAVNVISGQYKVHLEHKKAYAEEGKKKFALLQVVMATKIKAKYRMVLQRRKAKHALYCATVITLAARRYLYVYRVGIRFRKAARYHRKKVQKKYFDVIVGLVTATREFLLERAAQLNPLMARRLQRTTLRKFRAFQSELIEDKYDKAAEVVWEANIKVTLIAKWKELIGISTAKNLKLNKIFMNCVGIETMNSMRQKSDRDRAEMFFTRRIILPAWVAFCDDYLRAQRAAKKEPMAIEHFRLSFAARVTALCFKAVNDYRKYRQWRKGLIVTAEEQYLRHKLQLGVKFLKARREYRLYHRGQHIKAMVSTRKFWKKVTLKNRLPFVTKVRRYTDKIYKYVDQYRREYLVEIGFQDLKNSCLMLRNFRIMNAIAEQFLHNKTKVKVFRGWKKYHIFVKNINQFVKDHYQGGLMRRAIYGLRHNWAGAKAYKLELQRKLEQKIKSEEEYLILTKGAIKLQAVVRGANIREWAIDKRTTQMYSIRIIQGFVRRGLALRAYRRKTRAVKLALVKSEEAELDLMRIAEAETKYYEYHMSAATMIQRNFRGFSSREITNVMAIERTKGRGMDFYEAAAKMRARHENFKRAELAKQKAREKAIAKIQARVRGMIQRKKFDEIKYQGKVAKYAFLCQTWYRGKLARMKLAALRRDKVGELRFKAARRQRGMLLRMLGFWNRKSQNRFASVIGALGLDPITFNYRLNELWADVVKDYYVFINTIKREKELYDEHKGNRLLMTNGRRKILSNAGWTLKINDAVRIVDEEHKFYGYTGIVVRIDTDIPGLPLFEVKLDGLPRQTFAMMTTDALVAYDQQQVLARIEKFPVLEGFEQPFVMYGLDPEDPFFAENAVDAAWTIQRGWRCHRARNIVARKRYEMWTRASHNQWALYDHLADSNVISAQAYNITGWAGLRYKKKIRFDALRHTAIPIRLITNRNLVPEAPAIRQEFEIKYRQRIHYLERSAITQDREFFHIGYERMTTMRKMALCTRVIWGFIRQGGSNIKDMVGRKGARYLAKQKNLVTGADHFAFPQMQGSPHVRYSKTIIYHGEWSGIPLFTPLVPHGEGMVIFLEGWGFAREDKVLYLTIIRCTRLMMMDLTSSDPFCDIFCNAKNLQTSVKYGQMNPEFHERFEIDVTNPSATVKIVVKDKDFLSDDDFMGQVELKLNDFRDGKEHHLTETLRDEFGEFEDDNDRGDIEFKIQWTDRVFTDDVQKQARRVRATIQLQAWIRRINAKVVLKGLRRERIELLEMVREKAVLMCCVVRRRLAYKVAKRLKRRLRACIKLQKRMRIYLAKKCVRNRRGNWEKAIILQSFIRGILGKAVLRRLREKRIQLLQSSATCMQKWVRRLICRCREARRRDMGIIEAGAGYVAPVRQPVSEWIDTYGTDPDYGLRRTKRVYENTFSRMLKKKYCRIKSKYGFVFVDQYPPQELDKYDDEDLCIRDDFVAVFLPSMEPRLLHLEVAIASIQRAPHNAIMHLPSAISVRGSVDMVTTQIQCAVRQMFANKYYKKLLKVRIAVILLQRAFRKRFEKLHSASLRISAFFRLIIANRVTQVRRIEINSAKLIQCGVRCWIARSRKFDLMCIRRASILKFSSAIPDHGPEKLLDFKSHTYWLSDSPERAEVRIELKKRQAVEEIWVMTCTRQASAQSVTISVVTDKRTMKYDTLYHDITLPLQNGRQWRKFPFNAITAKFFKLSFGYNYGDEDHIGVRQIRFVKAKESK